jgi:hypothetical protein
MSSLLGSKFEDLKTKIKQDAWYTTHHSHSHSSPLGVTTIESFSLLNDISPFTTVLDADCPVLYLHFTDVLFNTVIPSALTHILSLKNTHTHTYAGTHAHIKMLKYYTLTTQITQFYFTLKN